MKRRLLLLEIKKYSNFTTGGMPTVGPYNFVQQPMGKVALTEPPASTSVFGSKGTMACISPLVAVKVDWHPQHKFRDVMLHILANQEKVATNQCELPGQRQLTLSSAFSATGTALVSFC